ncbi:MAG TPA: DUF397 domain-containing protein [Pseudonocardiaceae bacterium]|nr:DUF397 domain-containing protein [Pseudonocardiaceae bacterium]
MIRWRKAGRSQNTSNCVEIAHGLDQLRDSKNTTGPVLQADIRRLVADIKAGHLNG